MKIPYKIEIEYYMIATLIMNPELMKKLSLKEEYFFHWNNRLAYNTLIEMCNKNEIISLVTFGSRFFDVGGKISEVNALFNSDDYYNDLFADTYLRILSDEFIKREISKKYTELSDAPKEFIAQLKKLEMDFIENRPKNIGELYEPYLKDYADRKEKMKNKGAVGVVTGFKIIDEKCSFEEGNLIVLAAKTSVGKTSLALNIAINTAMFEQKVMFFSVEMTIKEILNRVFAQLTGVSSTKFKYANADASLPLVKNEIEQCKDNLSFIESAGLTSKDVCRAVRKQGNVDLVVVDYIQYLKDTVKNGNNNDRIGNIMRNLKEVAKECNCSVLALSQVNRATTGAPGLENLRDSGNIEQDSDVVMILHRENKDDVIADLIIAKNRNGQVYFDGKLKFKPSLTKFYE